MNPLDAISAQRVLPILRTTDADDAVATARACVGAGMRVVELTYSIPDVETAISELRAAEEEVIVGIGTVSEPQQVHASVDAGAAFVVTFARQPGVIEAGAERGVPVICGALTPTEVADCRRAGADAVKLFPARLIEPAYLRDLRAVQPDLRLVVTGGIAADPDGVWPWLEAGAMAVGLGGALGTAAGNGAGEVERRCRAVLDLKRAT